MPNFVQIFCPKVNTSGRASLAHPHKTAHPLPPYTCHLHYTHPLWHTRHLLVYWLIIFSLTTVSAPRRQGQVNSVHCCTTVPRTVSGTEYVLNKHACWFLNERMTVTSPKGCIHISYHQCHRRLSHSLHSCHGQTLSFLKKPFQ